MRAGADAAREEPVAIGYALLANPLYAGRVRHKGKVHPGQHKGVADEALWQAVQERLAANRQRTARRADARDPSPLAGKLIDPDGRRMRPSHATKNGRRYRYYISADLVEGSVETGATGWRITISDIARRDGIHAADVSRSMQLAFLAPDIVEAVIDGSQPEGLTSESLKRFGELPLAWDEQRAMLR